MRGIMIATGAVLIARFQWILPAFGVFLVYTGLHMLWKRGKQVRYENNPVFRFASTHLRVTKEYHGGKFFLRQSGQFEPPRLSLVLLVIEITDVTFAVDSIPAIFGITRDPFIVFTSNVFAILGLRALYFLLSDLLDDLRYLGIGLALSRSLVRKWWWTSGGMFRWAPPWPWSRGSLSLQRFSPFRAGPRKEPGRHDGVARVCGGNSKLGGFKHERRTAASIGRNEFE